MLIYPNTVGYNRQPLMSVAEPTIILYRFCARACHLFCYRDWSGNRSKIYCTDIYEVKVNEEVRRSEFLGQEGIACQPQE